MLTSGPQPMTRVLKTSHTGKVVKVTALSCEGPHKIALGNDADHARAI